MEEIEIVIMREGMDDDFEGVEKARRKEGNLGICVKRFWSQGEKWGEVVFSFSMHIG